MSLQDIILNILQAIFGKTPVTPQPTPVPVPPTPQNFIDSLLQLHNTHRQQLGLKPLNLNQLLINSAQKHSDWMFKNNTLNHFENSKGPGDRISAEGYKWQGYGENIAAGYPTVNAVFQGWLNSPGHKAIIETPSLKDVGFGVAGKYWTTDFATSTPGLNIRLMSNID